MRIGPIQHEFYGRKCLAGFNWILFIVLCCCKAKTRSFLAQARTVWLVRRAGRDAELGMRPAIVAVIMDRSIVMAIAFNVTLRGLPRPEDGDHRIGWPHGASFWGIFRPLRGCPKRFVTRCWATAGDGEHRLLLSLSTYPQLRVTRGQRQQVQVLRHAASVEISGRITRDPRDIGAGEATNEFHLRISVAYVITAHGRYPVPGCTPGSEEAMRRSGETVRPVP